MTRTLETIAADPGGDPVEALRALRVKVGQMIDNCMSARDLAALARRYEALTVQIAEAEAEVQDD